MSAPAYKEISIYLLLHDSYMYVLLPNRIIAVSYEARAHGVTRNMWVDDAKKLCPDLKVARVRESHGKADLTL